MNIREIARIAEVSHSTVSRALRNNPHISLATRQRIQKIAQENGYRPNPTVSKLMAQLPHIRKLSRATLALVTCWPQWEKVAFLKQIHEGVRKRSDQLGYAIEEFSLYELSMVRLNEILLARGIEGVIVFPFDHKHSRLELDWSRFTGVAIGRFLLYPEINRISPSNYENMRLALQELQALGYRRIALALTSEIRSRVEDAYIAAYSLYEHDTPLDRRIPVLVSVPEEGSEDHIHGPVQFQYTDSLGSRDILDWLKWNQADALICNYSPTPNLLRKFGIRIPKDLGYATLDRSNAPDEVSGIDQQPEQLGNAAVDMITAHLHRNELGIPNCPKTMTIRSRWHPGATLLKIKDGASRSSAKKNESDYIKV